MGWSLHRETTQVNDASHRGRAARKKAHGRPESDRVVTGYIFRPYRDLPDGRRLWAKTYGLKAWRIPVYADETDVTTSQPMP